MKTVTKDYQVGFVSGAEPYARIRMDLHWTDADFLAIQMHLFSGPEQPVKWVVARDLIAAGLQRPSGEGDVHIRRHFADEQLLEIVISSQDGTALILIDRLDVLAFLYSTWSHVPADAPVEVSDVEIAQLMREVQP